MEQAKNYKIIYILLISSILILISLAIYFVSLHFQIYFESIKTIIIWTILAIIFSLILFLKYEKQAIVFNFLDDVKFVFRDTKFNFYAKIILFWIVFMLFFYMFAYPYKKFTSKEINKNWIDIVLTLDISTSMNAQDLKPSRLEAAKKIINQFLWKLKNDRVWLVVFAWKPFVSLPLTFDYNIVKETIKNLNTNIIDQNYFNWTAIWDALLMAKNLFTNKKSLLTSSESSSDLKHRTKVVILLTDGDANKWVDPILAAQYLKKHWIKVYTIWIGSKKGWIIPYQVWPFTQYVRIPPLKETTLRKIAQITNGRFFRATDNESLRKIFDEISKLEKSKIKIKKNILHELYLEPFFLAIIILITALAIFRFKEL